MVTGATVFSIKCDQNQFLNISNSSEVVALWALLVQVYLSPGSMYSDASFWMLRHFLPKVRQTVSGPSRNPDIPEAHISQLVSLIDKWIPVMLYVCKGN